MKYLFLALSLSFSYLPSFSQWIPVSSLPGDFRTDHSFAFVVRDTGYIMVGQSPNGLRADVYRYSVEQDEWTQLPDFPGGTRGYGIGDVWEDKAYFGFGTGTTPGESVATQKNDLWVFDPSTNEWTELSPCPCLPRLHPAFVAHQGNIYMGMGRASGVGNLDDWWVYDISEDTWTQLENFPSHSRHHPYQFAIGDYVYAGFGHGTEEPEIYKTWYRFDPATGTWMQVTDIPGEARVAGTQFSHGGYGYVLSGDGDDHKSMETGEFWKYDANEDAWEQLPSHPGFSRWAPASFILDNEVYLFNGSSFGVYLDTCYKYDLGDPMTNQSVFPQQQAEYRLYPNPFTDRIVFESLPGFSAGALPRDVAIYDMTGRMVFDIQANQPVTSLDLGHLPDGTYIMECRSEADRLTKHPLIKVSD